LTATNISRAELVKGVTSGSSGQPTHYIQEKSSNRIRTAAGKRLTGIAGYDLGQKLFYLWRDSPFVIEGDQVKLATEVQKASSSVLGKLKQAIHSRFGVENQTLRVDPTLMTESEMANMYEQLRLFKPDVVISYVSTLYMFAQYLDANCLVGRIVPRSVIVSSETLYPHQRELLERVFGCSVYNRYGLSETGIVAIECPVREGLHLNQEILHVESMPDSAGNSQLVVTDLINHGMPLLRYETGDTGRVIEERCACGRGLSRIVDLSGRIIDLLPTRMGGYVNGQLFATFHWIEGVKQYQVIQEKIDAFKIRIIRTPSFAENNLAPMLQTIHERFGRETSIEVDYVESIPFTRGGKYKLVVSEVKLHKVLR
jgi:phenylacetate-CoA ligase